MKKISKGVWWFSLDVGGFRATVCCTTVWSCSWFMRERKSGCGRHSRVIHTSGHGWRRWRKTVIHYFHPAERHYGQLLQVTDVRSTVLSVSTLTAHAFLLPGLTTAPRHLSRPCRTGQTRRAVLNNGEQKDMPWQTKESGAELKCKKIQWILLSNYNLLCCVKFCWQVINYWLIK